MTTKYWTQLLEVLHGQPHAAVIASQTVTPGDKFLIAGAYTGDTVYFVRSLYPEAEILAFEPQDWAADYLRQRFDGDARTHIYQYGLGVTNEQKPMFGWGSDGASFVLEERPTSDQQGFAEIREIGEVFDELGVTDEKPIKLAVINVEGYEYTLFPHILSKGLEFHLPSMLIQMHYRTMSDILDRTHLRVWAKNNWEHWVVL